MRALASIQLHIEAKELLSRHPNPVKEPRAGSMEGISDGIIKITRAFARALTKKNVAGGQAHSFTKRRRRSSGDGDSKRDSARRRSSGKGDSKRDSARRRSSGSGKDERDSGLRAQA